MNTDGSPQTAHEALYHQDVVRRLLTLREDLGRHDENLKAYRLLQCAPYFIEDHPAIVEARDDAYQSVKHALPRDELHDEDRDADPYEAYYASNENERAFEDQYGLSVEESHRLPRVQRLLDWLAPEQLTRVNESGLPYPESKAAALELCDLAGNDGWMAARLSLDGYRCAVVDLNDANIGLTLDRAQQYTIGHIVRCAAEDAPARLGKYDFDAVVAFELIEHVADPRRLLFSMLQLVKPGGFLALSTPAGAVEQGNVPGWAAVEPKGHVRVYTEQSFRSLLEEFGQVEELVEGEDRVLVARVRPHG